MPGPDGLVCGHGPECNGHHYAVQVICGVTVVVEWDYILPATYKLPPALKEGLEALGDALYAIGDAWAWRRAEAWVRVA